ncbi:hypothetical protein Tco_0752439 [Tanacetum coccineum]|uniref:Uncharacterized protein n=1 Tax=Tanacetum coccineum TaxID=301880 RepID=A0ABQ4ZAK3_9ASTR
MHTNKSFNINPANHQLYHALIEALIEDENAMDKGVADTVKDHKRKHDDDEDDDDEDPLAGPNHGNKSKRRRTKESESSKKPSSTKETPKGKTLTKGSKTEGVHYPFDLSKPLPIQGPPGHRIVDADYFFNHDLEYLKTYNPELFHLDENVIVDFIVALRMFTRSLILKRHVEDLQLGVESYQKKLNITKPHNTFPEIEFKEPYTPSYDPPRIVYEDLDKQKRVLQADKLYKFSNGTLKSVHNETHHTVLNFHLDYNTEMPKRKWTAVDRKRSGLMVELIDKKLREREIIRNLERLVGARELKMDYKLMTRTI